MSDPVIYTRLDSIEGPLIMLTCPLREIGFGESVQLADSRGRMRHGRVALLDGDHVIVEVFEGTHGLAQSGSRIRFMAEPVSLNLDASMLGRRLNGMGEPVDGGPPLTGALRREVMGAAINPVARDYPVDFIQTGISAIDGMNALVRGQKLPIFSGSGLPHDQLAIQIARQARIRPDLHTVKQSEDVPLVVVFVAIGVKHDVAMKFYREIRGRTVSFLNLADDPPMERLLAPRMALTAAEYLAFDLGMHVLVIMTDITNYCEALREIATARGDVPSRKGYPGYLYSDLASLYERAGRIQGRAGSITQIPILTMPNNDITHPIPDLTGYITEGQLVLSSTLHRQGLYPPMDLLPSLSRLMKDGVGEGLTRSDHFPIMSQLYAAYARSMQARLMSRIIGKEDISEVERTYLHFGDVFERYFEAQAVNEERGIEETLDLAWRCLGILPESELTRLSAKLIDTHKNLLAAGREEIAE